MEYGNIQIINQIMVFWITRYSANPKSYPGHWITIDMRPELAIDGFTINLKSGDRKIKNLEIRVSSDNAIWESVGEFDLKPLDMTMQYLPLPQRQNTRYFKILPISGHDNHLQPALAEVGTFRYED